MKTILVLYWLGNLKSSLVIGEILTIVKIKLPTNNFSAPSSGVITDQESINILNELSLGVVKFQVILIGWENADYRVWIPAFVIGGHQVNIYTNKYMGGGQLEAIGFYTPGGYMFAFGFQRGSNKYKIVNVHTGWKI